ncbi:MAG: hypothetical protein ABI408_05580 [Gemmatimonadaceae bacterium]
MKTPRVHPLPFAKIALCAGMLAAPAAARAQQADHAMHEMSRDTLSTAPTTPTRSIADSARIADSLLALCRPHIAHSIDAYSTCIGDGIASLSSAGNIALAMGALDAVIHNDKSLVLLGHPLAHALGYAVRSTPTTATALLSECDDRYQSGCYHGILQRYFDARVGMPLTQRVLVAPCDGLRGTKEQFRLFDCLHGTGHGLMMYHGYDVNASLRDCDRLAANWDQRSCYSGVFMEYNLGARMQSFGEGMFGMHRHSMPAPSIVLFKPTDLQYPCNATPERYRPECYELQADLILPAVKQDYHRAGQVCDAAGSQALVHACYTGLGRNASGASAFQYAGIKKRCEKSSALGMPYCYAGAVRHLAYARSELPRGIAFCESLPAGDSRSQCWDGIGLQIGGFFSDPAERRRACRAEDPRDVTACAQGAGIAVAVQQRSDP